MSIHLGHVRRHLLPDPDTTAKAADRHARTPHERAARSANPTPTRQAPLTPAAFGPVERRFAHLAGGAAVHDSGIPNRALREGPSGAQAAGAVQLSAAQQRDLAQRYAPVRYLHPDEKSLPGNPQTFLDHARPVRDGNTVRLDAPKDQLKGNVQDAPTYYRYDANTRTMTYWYFYPNNDAPGPWFDHQGDWERVEVQFNQGMQPTAARYSNHETHNTYAWDTLPKEDGRPVVYVAKGTHANSAYTGQHAPPGTPAVGARDEFARGTRLDAADDLKPLDDQPWTNSRLQAQYGADKVLWGGTVKDDRAGVVGHYNRYGPPTIGLDTHYVHGDSPDGPQRAPYAAADVSGVAEDILLVGKEKWSGDDDHKRLTALSGELLANEGDPQRRAQLIGELLKQDDGAFGSWLKPGIADDLVDDGRITPEQRALIRESVDLALDQGLIDKGPTGWAQGSW